ncbi:hypothetical protein O3794_02730 [Gemella sanguinis]|uniref:hypothetical protein n=1 Tax=Gemella sanguinis TaxID=84135 RepID=UPI00352D803A
MTFKKEIKFNIDDIYSDNLQYGHLPDVNSCIYSPSRMIHRALENARLKFELLQEEKNMKTEEQLEKTLKTLGMSMGVNSEKCIKAFEDFLNAIKESKEYKPTMLKGLREYYNIDFGSIESVWCTNDSKVDRVAYESGALYEIEEQAEWELKKRKLIFKIEDWAVNTYGNELTLDWGNRFTSKYYIYQYEDHLKIGVVDLLRIPMLLPYFATEEQARECIEKFGDEIKEVLF